MAPSRAKFAKKGLATTKPGFIIKKQIPIKTNQWNETIPGFIEADTVAHCGSTVAGMFVYSLNCVDIASGWTEQRAVWGTQQSVWYPNRFRSVATTKSSLALLF